ncbi:MAG TPA: hypothetical protein VKV69_03585 [Actinomycetota bacterium]|nr:hypothetical protein [Actinomycetota bacterium]
MADVTVHDFRILDRILAETDPNAGDVVYLGGGNVAFPFLVIRRLSGPGGVYIDALEVIDADGKTLGSWERQFELDGESKPRVIDNELRDVRFPAAGTYNLQYSVFDDVVATFPFQVLQQESPTAGIVPGPLDAALSKSTIAWLSFAPPLERSSERPAAPVKVPRYEAHKEWPIWYGYEDGRVYVLVGPSEQEIPGLVEAASVRLIARSKDKRSEVADVECSVEKLPKDARWDTIARDLLVGRRLNLKDGDAAVNRWKKECEIVMLTPLPPVAPVEDMAVVTA